jgi:hypothetical protein
MRDTIPPPGTVIGIFAFPITDDFLGVIQISLDYESRQLANVSTFLVSEPYHGGCTNNSSVLVSSPAP